MEGREWKNMRIMEEKDNYIEKRKRSERIKKSVENGDLERMRRGKKRNKRKKSGFEIKDWRKKRDMIERRNIENEKIKKEGEEGIEKKEIE